MSKPDLWHHGGMIRSYLLVSSLQLIMAFSAQANLTLKSEFALSLTNEIFKTPEMDPNQYLAGERALSLADFSVVDPLPTNVSGLNGRIQYQFSTAPDPIHIGTERAIVSKSFGMQLTIGRISSHGDMVIDVGGTPARIRVDAECTNVQVRLVPNSIIINALLRTDIGANGLVALSIPWLDWNLTADAFRVDPFTCEGTPGFSAQIERYILSWLSDKSRWDAILRERITAELAGLQSQINNELLKTRLVGESVSPYLGKMRLTVAPARIDAFANQDLFLLRGLAFLELETNKHGEQTLNFEEGIGLVAPWKLYLPDGLLSRMAAMAYTAGVFQRSFSGNDFTAFRDLKNSSLKSAVVWPELNRYSSPADFTFATDLNGALKAELDPPKTTEEQVRGQLIFPLHSLMHVTVRKRVRPMMHLYLPLDMRFNLAIRNQTLLYNVESLNTQLSMQWDASYRPVAKAVDVKTIEGGVKSLISNTSENELLKVPDVQLNSQITLKATNLTRRSKVLIFHFDK